MSTGPHGPRDVIFTFTFDSWADAVRRGMFRPPDRLLQTLLGHPEVGRVLVVNPFRSLPVRMVRRVLDRDEPRYPRQVKSRLMTPLRLRRRDPATSEGLERAYRFYDRQVHWAARRMGLQEPAVITTSPLVAGFAPFEWAGPVTYYARDDLGAHPVYSHWHTGCQLAHDRLRWRHTDRRVCAVSEVLLGRIDPKGPGMVVPNGIDPEEWAELPSPPQWFSELPRPRVLYVGGLNFRIDVEGLLAAAARLPHASFVLVGEQIDPGHLEPLRARLNVHFGPTVDRSGLVGLVGASQACMIPHRRSALTEAMSPLKLFEYLAGGSPVAATDLPPIRDVSPRVVLGDEGAGFVSAVEKALALGPAPEAERRRFIEENSWARRHQDILEVALAP